MRRIPSPALTRRCRPPRKRPPRPRMPVSCFPTGLGGRSFSPAHSSIAMWDFRTSGSGLQDPAAALPGLIESPASGESGVAKVNLKVNGKAHSLDIDPATPLLYVLRNDL